MPNAVKNTVADLAAEAEARGMNSTAACSNAR